MFLELMYHKNMQNINFEICLGSKYTKKALSKIRKSL